MIAFGMMADLFDMSRALPQGIAEMIKVAARVDDHYVRDEGAQAQEVSEQLTILDRSGVEGAFVFTFVSPNSPYNPDPRFDIDMASYSLVKSYPEKGTVEELVRGAATQGKELLGVDLPPDVLSKFATDCWEAWHHLP